MIKDISINSFIKMREHIREMDDFLSNIIKIDEKMNVIKETDEDIERAKRFLPHEYYNIRIENQSVMIDIVYNKKKRQKLYGIKCTNFRPLFDTKLEYNSITKTYGEYEELEDCKKLWLKIVADLLYKNGFNIYESLELFL